MTSPYLEQRRFLIPLGLSLLIITWGMMVFPAQTATPIIENLHLPHASPLYNPAKAPDDDDLASPKVPIHNPVQVQGENQEFDLTHIAEHVAASSPFEYARRTIKTRLTSPDDIRPDLTYVNESLLPQFQLVHSDNLTHVSLRSSLPTLTVSVPRSQPVDASAFSFGFSTKTARLQDTLLQLQHWLPDTGAQLHVAVPSTEVSYMSHEFNETGLLFHASGINLTLHTSDLPSAQSYFSLIKTLYDARSPNTKWLVLMDDDTFIPSLPHLAHHLATRYNASEEVMVAALSDSWRQISTFGLLPYGGGGIFISVPLAASLVREEVWGDCMEYPGDQGDQMVNECLNAHSKVRPNYDVGLNQMDINGDPSGYFESGRRMLTIHHWKSWFHVNVPMAGNVSRACGFECVFQRWAFRDDFVLSNGFSLVGYTDGIPGGLAELEKVELTWDAEAKIFVHHIGPLREADVPGTKTRANLEETTILDGVGVRQIYIERVQDDQSGARVGRNTTRVVELLWLL